MSPRVLPDQPYRCRTWVGVAGSVAIAVVAFVLGCAALLWWATNDDDSVAKRAPWDDGLR